MENPTVVAGQTPNGKTMAVVWWEHGTTRFESFPMPIWLAEIREQTLRNFGCSVITRSGVRILDPLPQ